jgi:hypothetical protein
MLHNSSDLPTYQDLDDHIVWHVTMAMSIILVYILTAQTKQSIACLTQILS